MRVVWAVLSLSLLWGVAPVGAAIPNTVGWHNTGVNLNSACESFNWATGCKIVEPWGSAGYDDRRNRMFFTGGGHSDGRGNEMVAFNVGSGLASAATQSVERIVNGTTFTSVGTCTQNGSWISHHGWNMAFVRGKNASNIDTAANDRYVFSIQGTSDAGNMGMDCFVVYNPNTGTHTITTHHADLANVRVQGSWGGSFATDIRQGKLIALSFESILYWDVLNGWQKPTQTAFSANSEYNAGVIDTKRKRYYSIGDGNIWWWNISGTGTITRNVVSVHATCTTAVSTYIDGPPGMDYYPVTDKIIIWRGGSTIYSLDPATHTCTSQTVSGGPSVTALDVQFIGKKFHFVWKDQMFVTCNNTTNAGSSPNDQCWALRLNVQSAETDFAVRCNGPGVVQCESFDTLADYTNGQKYFNGDGGFDGADCDTSVKASGTCALRFNLPAGRATSDISGSWIVPLTNSTYSPLTGLGAGVRWYIQYRQRITPTMRTNLSQWRAGSDTGWKTLIMYNSASGSCDTLEYTRTTYPFGNSGTQVFYMECGNRGLALDSNGTTSPGNENWYQSGTNFAAKTGGYWCDSGNQIAGSGNGLGCFRADHDSEWVTFYNETFINNFTTASSDVIIKVAREGATSYTNLLTLVGNVRFSTGTGGTNNFNRALFSPYMTSLNTAASSSANMWIDEFIVSTEPIPVPGQFSSGDTTAPSAPTGITVQ